MTELHARDIVWTIPSRDSELLLSDDDIQSERQLFRQALGLACGLVFDRTQDLERVRAQYRALRERVMREDRRR
jgi:hypothetical protein